MLPHDAAASRCGCGDLADTETGLGSYRRGSVGVPTPRSSTFNRVNDAADPAPAVLSEPRRCAVAGVVSHAESRGGGSSERPRPVTEAWWSRPSRWSPASFWAKVSKGGWWRWSFLSDQVILV